VRDWRHQFERDVDIPPKENDMSFLITLLIIFLVFAVAGWGWRFTRRR
jgi:hypothetical protein